MNLKDYAILITADGFERLESYEGLTMTVRKPIFPQFQSYAAREDTIEPSPPWPHREYGFVRTVIVPIYEEVIKK